MISRKFGPVWWRVAVLAAVMLGGAMLPSARAEDPKPADPTLEQRVADLEAYVNNGSRTANVASKVAGPGPGHNAWMMTSSALVLFMTLPGLALFYGGLVRKKNVLSVLAQCFGITGLVTILWWAVGYSLVFANGTPFLGGLKFAFLRGVDSSPNTDYGAWVSHNVYCMYQLMFAIITPALIIGAIAERMKFTAILAFVTAWMFLVYFPLAHAVWGVDGAFNGLANAKVLSMGAARYLRGAPQSFDIVFMDPPFGQDALAEFVPLLDTGGWLSNGSLVYLENERTAGVPRLPSHWELLKSKSAGEVGYHLARFNGRTMDE